MCMHSLVLMSNASAQHYMSNEHRTAAMQLSDDQAKTCEIVCDEGSINAISTRDKIHVRNLLGWLRPGWLKYLRLY